LLDFLLYWFLQNPACVISGRLVDIAPHDFRTIGQLDYIKKRGMHRDIYLVHGKTVMSWINCSLTLCVFLVGYNLWSGSPNGGSPYSGEVDFGSSILKQSNSLLYKIWSFSGFCIQSLSHPTPLSLLYFSSTFWKSQHTILQLYRLTVLCPRCYPGSPSTWSCSTGALWWWDSIGLLWNCKDCGMRNISLR